MQNEGCILQTYIIISKNWDNGSPLLHPFDHSTWVPHVKCNLFTYILQDSNKIAHLLSDVWIKDV